MKILPLLVKDKINILFLMDMSDKSIMKKINNFGEMEIIQYQHKVLDI